jgi:aminoglycoside phosphotransferase (APT) family kinase protein
MSLGEQLAAYLTARVGHPVEVTSLARKSGGASRETYLFDARWVEGAGAVERAFVLRRDPVASLLESDRRHEFQAIEAAGRIGIPVPRVCWIELDPSFLERPFFIMERVEGMPTPPTFPAAYPVEMRARTAADFAAILARIHRADWRAAGFDFLEDPGPGREAARRATATWRRVFEQDRIEAHPLLERAFAWLEANLPATDRVTLVHGDYRSGNYLHDMQGGITAILDWEMTHLGDPHEDLGWATMPYWFCADRAGGLEPTSDMLARYAELSRHCVDPASVHFYQVLGTVKMLVISLTGVRNYCDARTAEPTLAIVAFLAPRLLGDLVSLLGLAEAR